MPTIQQSDQPLAQDTADVVAVFAAKGEDGIVFSASAAQAEEALGIDLRAELQAVRFEGERDAVARVPTRGAMASPLLMVVGLGPVEGLDHERVRRGAGVAARQAAKDGRLTVAVPDDLLDARGDEGLVRAVTEGAALGGYAFTEYRTKNPDKPSLQAIGVHVHGFGEQGVREGRAVAQAVNLARDLVNTPPGDKRPPALADRAARVAQDAGLQVRVFDESELAEGGFGGLIGVGQGSSEPPRLVELTWDPPDAHGHVALVGKGITFDTGGISLKPTASMTTMKSDMGGSAAVLAVMSALRDLDVKVKVTGLMALAENMPSGTATRVSDVLTHRDGTTVEVMNTDAEGRLVLADALAYAVEQGPDAIVDLATLTGAQIVALGSKISGLMGSDDQLLDALEAAAAEAGERVWRLPLPEDYAEQLKSQVADFKNIGKAGNAGTIVAGLFLKEFTGDVAWAHLDIAGPAFADEADGYVHKGGTGVGVRMLLAWLRSRGV